MLSTISNLGISVRASKEIHCSLAEVVTLRNQLYENIKSNAFHYTRRETE